MEWAPFKYLFWDAKKLNSKVSDFYYNILAFASITNLIRDVKNLPPNFKQICKTMFYITHNSHSDR